MALAVVVLPTPPTVLLLRIPQLTTTTMPTTNRSFRIGILPNKICGSRTPKARRKSNPSPRPIRWESNNSQRREKNPHVLLLLLLLRQALPDEAVRLPSHPRHRRRRVVPIFHSPRRPHCHHAVVHHRRRKTGNIGCPINIVNNVMRAKHRLPSFDDDIIVVCVDKCFAILVRLILYPRRRPLPPRTRWRIRRLRRPPQ